MGLLYIWVTCDKISVWSGEYDTLILKSSCDSQLNAFLFTATLLYGMPICIPKMFLSLLGTHDYYDTT